MKLWDLRKIENSSQNIKDLGNNKSGAVWVWKDSCLTNMCE